MHDQGPGEAEVTEGSHGIWERLHYDWSDPDRVIAATIDSNVWGGCSGHTYTLTRRRDGTTEVEVAVVREGKNPQGRVLAAALATLGKPALRQAPRQPVKAIEARSDDATVSRKNCASGLR
ncbi:hypothetical protein ACFROC_23500 [Nocardia tengchongensis]|uniref:hypothetical protein n=1 Tax=Nocardia tengchongensis TaxID=2055889 RepID=UPI003679EA38